jgi:hypothetical protein
VIAMQFMVPRSLNAPIPPAHVHEAVGLDRSELEMTKRLLLMRSERFGRFALGTPALIEIAA